MSAQRRTSLTDKVARICSPDEGTTADRARLICFLCNYVQKSRKHIPNKGQERGFFDKPSENFTLLKATKRMGLSNKFVEDVGPFSDPKIAGVKVTIEAKKSPLDSDDPTDYSQYLIRAAAIATDAENKFIKKGYIDLVASKLSDELENEWINMSFDTLMDRLRWGCKIVFDSSGENRQFDDEGAELARNLGLFTSEEFDKVDIYPGYRAN